MSTATFDQLEDIEPAARGRSLTFTLLWFIVKLSTILGLTITGSFMVTIYATQAWVWVCVQANTAYAWGLSQLPKQEIVQFVSAQSVPIEQVLDAVSKEFNYDPSILRAQAMQESGGFVDANRVKDEPQLLQPSRDRSGKIRPPAIVPPRELNDIEKLMWASSHGVLQVIFGLHWKTCNLPVNGWDKLHDPLTNIRCGAAILRDNLARHRSVSDQGQRLWLALRDYNGSGPDAEAYANEVMARIAKLRKFNYGKGV